MTEGFPWRLELFEGWFYDSESLLLSCLFRAVAYILKVFHLDKHIGFLFLSSYHFP